MQYNIVFLLSLLILITSCNPDPCPELYLRKPNAYIDDTRTFVKTGSYETDPLYTGRCGLYYENNEPRAIQEYLDGQEHGKWTAYFENGQKEMTGVFKNGKRVGKWKYYHDNGAAKQVAYYKDGMRDGTWSRLDRAGDTLWVETYPLKKDSLN